MLGSTIHRSGTGAGHLRRSISNDWTEIGCCLCSPDGDAALERVQVPDSGVFQVFTPDQSGSRLSALTARRGRFVRHG